MFKNLKHGNTIQTVSDKALKVESNVAIYTWKVTCNYAYSPFNVVKMDKR